MKTAMLECLLQFSSKKNKNIYNNKIIKRLKSQLHCQIVQNVRFSL